MIFPATLVAGHDFDFRDHSGSSRAFRRGGRPWIGWIRVTPPAGHPRDLAVRQDVPVHRVAELIGDDPPILLRNYAERKQTDNRSVATVINDLSVEIFGSLSRLDPTWVPIRRLLVTTGS